MAKKDFIKEKVFKTKTVEDIFEEVYNEYTGTRDVLNDYIANALNTIGDDMDKLLLFTQNIKGLLDAGVKNNDLILKVVETIRRSIVEQKASPDEDSSKSLDSALSELRKNIMSNRKQIGQA
jgi:hypothetical protein